MRIEQDEVYTTKEVAEILKVSLPTVKRMLKDGRLPSVRIGKQHRFLGRDLIEILFMRKGIPEGEPKKHDENGAKKQNDDEREGNKIETIEQDKSQEEKENNLLLKEEQKENEEEEKRLKKPLFNRYGEMLFEKGIIVTEEVFAVAAAEDLIAELESCMESEQEH